MLYTTVYKENLTKELNTLIEKYDDYEIRQRMSSKLRSIIRRNNKGELSLADFGSELKEISNLINAIIKIVNKN